ncbi:MAG: hypothetical protein HQM03_11125 [Magnetococcales bacterium]|nr:hypothetical protein [Magnetococcales bacterium]
MPCIKIMARWVVVLVACAGIVLPLGAFAASDLQWKEETFTKTTFEEDIKVVLKDILRRNGLEAFFRPGVEGIVTFEFSNMPLQAAFNKILEEQGLAYEYLAETKTVTLFKRGTQSFAEDIFTPKFTDLTEVMAALERFNLLDGDIKMKHDSVTNSLFLKGDQVKVSNLIRIANRIDEAYNNKAEKDLKSHQIKLDMKNMDNSMASTTVEVKVIPLRYASVGTSKTTFQGESVSLPGIIESLKVFVGALEVRDERSDKTPNPKLESAIAQAIALGPMGKPVVSIDQRTNSVIVQGTSEQIGRIQKVIEELDQRVPLVEIEVMIVDGLADVTRQLGVNWGMAANFGEKGVQLATPTGVISTGAVPTLGLTAKDAGTASTTQSGMLQIASQRGLGAGFIYQGARHVLDATLSAMANDDKLQTIASPKVVTLNNLAAQITNSNNTNFIVTTGDGTRADIKTVSSGISLEITPSVILPQEKTQSRMVRLNINARNSTPGASNANSISTNDQQVRTNVIIPEDGTFIMGGLFNTSRAEVETGIPGLKDIPIMGRLFRSNTAQEQKRETVFLITPKIIDPLEIVAGKEGKQFRAQMARQRTLLAQETDGLQDKSKLINLPRDMMVDEEE